jgi:hypothetical protein
MRNFGSIPVRNNRLLSSSNNPDRLWVHPASYGMVPRAVFLSVKWQGHASNYLPPSGTEFKNDWKYISTLPTFSWST